MISCIEMLHRAELSLLSRTRCVHMDKEAQLHVDRTWVEGILIGVILVVIG